MKKEIIFFAIGAIASATGAAVYILKRKKSNPIDIFNRRDINRTKYEEQGVDKEDMNKSTLDNDNLSSEDRATSKLIFDYYYRAMLDSKDEEEFNDILDKMWDFYWVLNGLDKKKIQSYILYHKTIMNKSDGLDKIVNNAVDKIDLRKMIFKK